ncbi:MAG: hypothetical protein ABI797_03595 [Chloroflexota bacterium]
MPRTPVRRQGVIYGPPRPSSDGRDTGSFIGRLLGLGIIVLAMTVLAAGALAFLNRPQASVGRPTPSPAPSLAITPSATFSPEASATPAASPSRAPSGSVAPSSASPSPGAPTVQVGRGFVTFGTKADENVNITDPRATFTMSDTIRWSAYLTERADADDLRVLILKLDPEAENGERLISDSDVRLHVKAQRFGRRIDPSDVLDGPGTYVVRYVRGDTVMSEGSFLLEP